MSEKKPKRRVRTKSQKTERRKKAKAHGKTVLEYALKGGMKPNVPARAFTGSGGYDEVVGGIKNLVGSTLRSGADKLHGMAKGLISSVFGNGDYVTSKKMPRHNTYMGGVVPSLVSETGREFIMRRREFIGTITASVGFQLTTIPMQIGLPQFAPWGNGVANNYQCWVPHGVLVELVSTISPNSGGDANGVLCIAMQSNTSDPAPTSLASLENTEGSATGRPIDNILWGAECHPDYRSAFALKVRDTAITTTGQTATTLQLHDLGNLYIANQGQGVGTSQICQVWVSYDIALQLPKPANANNLSILSDHYEGTGVITGSPLGTAGSLQTGSTIGGSVAGQVYTFPSFITGGQWLVCLFLADSVGAVAASNITLSVVGGTLRQVWNSGTAFDINTVGACPSAGQSTTTQMNCYVVNITLPSATLTFGGCTRNGSSRCDLFITQFQGSLVTGRNRHRPPVEEKIDESFCDGVSIRDSEDEWHTVAAAFVGQNITMISDEQLKELAYVLSRLEEAHALTREENALRARLDTETDIRSRIRPVPPRSNDLSVFGRPLDQPPVLYDEAGRALPNRLLAVPRVPRSEAKDDDDVSVVSATSSVARQKR